MWKHFLFYQEIEEPIGFNASILQREFSSTYFGSFGNGFLAGMGSGTSTITTNDEMAVLLCKQEVLKYGVNAQIPYQLYYCGVLVFDGLVDNQTFEDDCCTVRFTVKERKKTSFADKRQTKYGIDTNAQCLFTGKYLAEKSGFILNTEIAESTYVGLVPKDYSHVVPIKFDYNTINGGLSQSIVIQDFEKPFFINDSGKVMNLEVFGSIKVKVKTVPDSNYTIVLLIKDVNDVLVNEIEIETNASDDDIIREILIAQNIVLKDGEKLFLKLVSDDLSTDYNIKYEQANIALSDLDTAELTESSHYGISLYDLLNELAVKMGIEQPICSNWLENCGKNYFITNGYNLRGIRKPLNVDFEYLFTNLSKIFCLGAELNDNCFVIEKRENMVNCTNSIDIGELTGFRSINKEFLYNRITVGYSKWQSGNTFGTDEFNSSHTYESSTVSEGTSLSLTSDLIASGYIIEKLRRMSFDGSNQSSVTDELDDRLFIISTVPNGAGVKAETNENFTDVSGIISPTTAYNLRISPKRNLMRWSKFIGGLGNMKLISYEGNINLKSTQTDECETTGFVNESTDYDTSAIPPFSVFKIDFDQELPPEYFNLIEKCITFTWCGEKYQGLVSQLTYLPTNNMGKLTGTTWILGKI